MRLLGLAEYGGDELFIATLAFGGLAFALSRVHTLLALIPVLPYAIVIWFFRDPNRSGPEGSDLLLSPADGTVSDICEMDEAEFIGRRCVRIGIFLSPLDVHVNRVPCDGTVQFMRYRAGEFIPAYNPQAPERNESVSLGLETRLGFRIIVKQVTGVLARRIICETQLGDELKRGERYGMIKFGSRTELYVPIQAYVSASVAVGDKVRGGESVCCKVKAVLPELPPEIVHAHGAETGKAGPAHAG